MKMSNNWATAALAATSMIIGTVPAAALPQAASGAPSVSEASAGNTNLQRKAGGRAGGAHAGGHAAGGARPAGGQAKAHPTRQAGAAHNVRSTSGGSINGNHTRNTNRNVNRNTNINRDVNIDVDNHGGWDNDWNDHYHPIAAGVAMGATAAIVGSIVSRPPTTGCVTTVANGISYTQCGNTWYQPQYSGTTVEYIVVNPPY